MSKVEVGLVLPESLDYYDNLLKEHGFKNSFNCETHDLYYTDQKLDGLTEFQMKNMCVRFRNKKPSLSTLLKYNLKGYKKVFDTFKKDHHYTREDVHGVIQLQEIKDIGLLLYYDNKDYDEQDDITQWNSLISELNTYGFNFDKDIEGLDKLRTLYYGELKFSKNQNG